MQNPQYLGDLELNRIHCGDCSELAARLPDECIDVIVTSPPYWGQRLSNGVGVEQDPREYVQEITRRFSGLRRVMKSNGLLWINVGDAYNTPINWKFDDHKYSSLGADKGGLEPTNSAYTKPRHNRRAFIDRDCPWLQYGNLLALPYRMVISLCDEGFLFRGEVIWKKVNPMPEGRCRRPHRGHEGIYLFAKTDQHDFSVVPPIKSVWEFANEGRKGVQHFSRFPSELPKRCIEAYGKTGPEVVVLDPFSGSGTTSRIAATLGCSYLGFEIDPVMAQESEAAMRRPVINRRPRSKDVKAEPALF